jgi:CBS domain-containing protein
MFDEPVIEISTSDVVTITPDTSIATAIGIMEKNKFHNLVVRASEGMYLVNVQDLLIASNPDSHVEEFMFKPHGIHKDTSTIDAICGLMDSGQRAAPVVNDDDALVGIVTEYDFMKRGSGSRILQDAEVIRVMSRNPICVYETDSIGKARSIMTKNNVGRVLVVDEMSNLLGIVTGGDILRKIFKPKRRMTSGEFTGEKVPRMEQPVSVIMNAPVITAELDANLADVANLLQQHDIRGIPIVKDGVPRGVITIQDILRYLRMLKEEAMVEVEIQGELDDEYKELAERILETEVRKIAKFARRVQWIKIAIKKERDRGGIPYYKITAQVKTPDKLYVGHAEPKPIKTITATAEDIMVEETKVKKRRWDFIEVLKDALLSVERQIEDNRERKRTQNRKALEK